MKVVYITYFVHGTTVDNEKGLSSGWADAGLSELGKKQSLELKNLIKGKRFDVVFCSDLKRAVDSAKLTYGNSVKIIQDKRLREIDYGKMTKEKCSKVEPVILNHIEKPFPGGESYKDVEKQMRSFLDDLLRNYSGKHVAIVGHKATQLALEVLLKGRTWEQAVKEDWRPRKAWQPGWEYKLE
jgi:broad specificity phosphatase PhoE